MPLVLLLIFQTIRMQKLELKFLGHAYEIGQVVVGYPSSMSLSLLNEATIHHVMKL